MGAHTYLFIWLVSELPSSVIKILFLQSNPQLYLLSMQDHLLCDTILKELENFK